MDRKERDERLSDVFLQRWIEEISLKDFHKPFQHHARYNPRLRSSGGRYLLKDHSIEINPRQLTHFGEEEVLGIIRHELCHYHLHREGKGYRHRDHAFKELLKQVQGTRYSRPIRKRRERPIRFFLQCTSCGMRYPRKRRINPDRYRCGICGGGLMLIPLSL